MTDNEKRAHDLAVAVSIDVCNRKFNIQKANNVKNISVDYFTEYMDAYETALEAFNQKFPDGK